MPLSHAAIIMWPGLPAVGTSPFVGRLAQVSIPSLRLGCPSRRPAHARCVRHLAAAGGLHSLPAPSLAPPPRCSLGVHSGARIPGHHLIGRIFAPWRRTSEGHTPPPGNVPLRLTPGNVLRATSRPVSRSATFARQASLPAFPAIGLALAIQASRDQYGRLLQQESVRHTSWAEHDENGAPEEQPNEIPNGGL
jgi:hypothetical protein